jgi:tRNA-Thr(GGU) m(6)t(6)A37 methyltransferase TsaA
MEQITLKPVGIIHTPHKRHDKAPIQPVFARGIKGTVTVDDEYADGLLDLDGFSHIYLVYFFDRVKAIKLRVCPYLQDRPHGVFATRAPCRPNPIGFSVVRLLSVDGATLHVEDVDMLDGSPLLDIKPYVARFDTRSDVRSGWQEDVDDDTAHRRGTREHPRA